MGKLRLKLYFLNVIELMYQIKCGYNFIVAKKDGVVLEKLMALTYVPIPQIKRIPIQ